MSYADAIEAAKTACAEARELALSLGSEVEQWDFRRVERVDRTWVAVLGRPAVHRETGEPCIAVRRVTVGYL